MAHMVRVFVVAALLAAATTFSSLHHPLTLSIGSRVDDFFDSEPDPGCQRGSRGGRACCPLICGTCGGSACQNLPAGGFCCQNIVFATGRDCDLVGSPCDINPPIPSASPMESLIPNPSMSDMPSPSIPAMGSSPSPSPSAMQIFETPAPEDAPRWINIDKEITMRRKKRSAGCFVMVRGKAYLLGGRGRKPKKVEIFNPKTRVWESGAVAPAAFHHAQCVVLEKMIYVVSSWFGSFPKEKNSPLIFIYNTKKGTWSTKDGLPEERRRGAAASVLLGNEIYVLGGSRGGHGPGSETVKWVDKYTVDTDVWTMNLRDMPMARDHFQGAVVGGKICVTGGRDGSQMNYFAAVKKKTYCMNAKGRWKNARADLPMARSGAAVVTTCNGSMMVAGGEGAMLEAISRVDFFDGTKWTQGADLVEGRHATGLAIARCRRCGQIFVTSGEAMQGYDALLDSTEVYLPDGVDKVCKKY